MPSEKKPRNVDERQPCPYCGKLIVQDACDECALKNEGEEG